MIRKDFDKIVKTENSLVCKYMDKTPGWRKLAVLKNPLMQIIFIILLPIFILDIWFHKFTSRFTKSRLYICDRYYDDIILNYTSAYMRGLIRSIIPLPNYALYFYASPEIHFMRKDEEEIEMIVHMQSCYSGKKYYHTQFPTSARKTFLGKKIVSMLVRNLP